MPPPVRDGRKPNLLAYSFILPAAWFAVGFVMMSIAPGVRLGAGLTFVMIGAVAVGIGWLFLRRHGRLFTASESWRMVIYCSLLAIGMEYFALWSALTWPEDYPDMNMSLDAAKHGFLFAAFFDSLFMIVAFQIVVPRYLDKHVPSDDDSTTNEVL